MTTIPQGEGLLASSKGFLSTFLATIKTRLELFATEVEEEKIRLGRVLALGVIAAFMLGLGLIFLFLFLAILFWESRLVIIGAAALIFLSGGFIAWRMLKSESERDSVLFAASLEELTRDLESLDARHPGESAS